MTSTAAITGTVTAMTMLPESLGGPRTRAELVAEIGNRRVRGLLADGRLRRLWPGVLAPREQLLDPLTRAAGALLFLGPAAALTGPTAAWLHGCPAAVGPVVHVAVPYSRSVRSRQGLAVHQGRLLLDELVDVGGLAVVPLEVAVTEVLCTGPARDALAIADQAAALFAPPDRPEFCAGITYRLAARADRRGTVRAADLLELVTGKAQSPPESWLRLLVVKAGFPPPAAQFELVDVWGRVTHVLDLCWPELRIALEYDGYETHDGREAEDAQRDEDLACRGWTTIRVRAADFRDPARLLHELDEAFRGRGVIVVPVSAPEAFGCSKRDLPRSRR